MKKIVCFISSLSSGGAEHQMAYLVDFLYEKGFSVTLVTCIDEPDNYEINSGIKRVKIQSSGTKLSMLFHTFMYLLKVDTDCIISFRERMNFVSLLTSIFRRNVKYIAGERNFTVGTPTIEGRICHSFLYYFADFIVANSYSQKKYLESLNKRWGQKVRTIINYTDINKYCFAPEPTSDDIINIGIFARFSPQKNVDGFIELLKKIKISSPRQFMVHWYGDRINEPGKTLYRNFITKAQMADVLDVLTPHDSVKDVQQKMQLFHAICLPSFFEGFSNSIAEGICCGKVMLVSDVSDNPIMVHDGENGFLFNPQNVENMEKAFIRFFSLDKEERLEMGRQSRVIALSLFDKEKFIDDYVKLIND